MKEIIIIRRLLFVDDDMDVLAVNKMYFEKAGFLVDTAISAEKALSYLAESCYECIILDIRMDGQDGYELCNTIRHSVETPIIFLTNLTSEESLIKSFDCGGDDYISKPYRLKELELRIQARMRRSVISQREPQETDHPGCIQILSDEQQAYINHTSLKLTVYEFQILQFLAKNKGVPFSQEEIYKALWGENFNTHSIQILIMRIRKKISLLSPDREYIRTQWGKGYFYAG